MKNWVNSFFKGIYFIGNSSVDRLKNTKFYYLHVQGYTRNNYITQKLSARNPTTLYVLRFATNKMMFKTIFNTVFLPKIYKHILPFILVIICCTDLHAQPGTEIEIEKPKKYENRKLASEKTTDKKIGFGKKVYQNTVTHYNYYFNANRRLNELIETAKTSFKDDYTVLLPFYNYTLDATSTNKQELDSIVYKCTAGILLHDLRNSWIDNMFLLLGKAYFFRKDFDSAGLTFQYINFSFSPKESGGYDVPIGSNSSNDKGEFSIVTKEKKSIWSKLTSRPPSRNESFIWQARNFIERDELPEAAGIIEILRHDPNFPKRLNSDLYQILSYWYYKQQVYDSAATYLTKSLDLAESGQEKARWEFLAAQMFQLSKKNEDAVKYYEKAMEHTTDPIMDVYARLNSIRIKKSEKKDYLQENIDELVKMAKRDKYANYRDIIYYAAANIELERKNIKNAQAFLLKSIENASNNPAQRSQAFLLLADMHYDSKLYPASSHYYDSLDVATLTKSADTARVNYRRPPLKIIAENAEIVYKQDSLQSIAKLSPKQQDSVIKKQLKFLRKSKGIKEEESTVNTAVQQTADIFSKTEKSNDFYFYNASTKAKGYSEFKAKWGERPNSDNWRRKSALDKQSQQFIDVDDVSQKSPVDSSSSAPEDSYEGMQANIPRTKEKVETSNKSIMDALYTMGKTFQNNLEEYPAAIDTYEDLMKRFPTSPYRQEVMFNLVYIYKKTGNQSKSDYWKRLLENDTTKSKWSQMVNGPAPKDSIKNNPATKKYEDIYKLFIEGNFAQAIAEKKIADSLYNKSFWTPQLLFIESIYYIKQQEDSTAIKVLTDLSTGFAGNPMAEKAKAMIEVLKRRKEIESYLGNLQVTRNEHGKPVSSTPHDPAANPTRTIAGSSTSVNKTDSSIAKINPVITKADSAKAKADSIKVRAATPIKLNKFSYVGDSLQYVGVLLDKVDPVYQSEAKNAFNRYNREKFYAQQIDISSAKIDDRYTLVLEGPFANGTAAVDYIEKVRPIAKSRILPWLSAEKFSFIIISQSNLETLKENKDIEGYKQLLQTAIPGKF